MARPRCEIPTYRLHLPRFVGKIVVDGESVYFPGRYGSAQSRAAYQAWLAEYLRTGRVRQDHSDQPEPTVGQLLCQFCDQQLAKYTKDGKPTSEQASFRTALRPLAELYADTPVSHFLPRDLVRCREMLVAKGYTRKRVNQHVQRVRMCFRWGVVEGLAQAHTWQALLAVPGLRHGEAQRESRKVLPIDEAKVEAIRPFVTTPVWAMIQLQLWTGMRPGEARQMRTCDITADDPSLPPSVRGLCWVYRPSTHKTEHHDRQRPILLGPHAQSILRPWLRPDSPDAYLFCPAVGRASWTSKKRGTGARPRKKLARVEHPKTTAGQLYGQTSYRHAIAVACEQAYGMPLELRKLRWKAHKLKATIAPDELSDLQRRAAAWRKAHCWHPHQLRHTAATKIRAAYGIEVARIVLGHANLKTTEIYAEADLEKAARAMADLG